MTYKYEKGLTETGLRNDAVRDAQQIMVQGQPCMISTPIKREGKWIVKLADVLGDSVEKVFPTQSRAMDFYTELWLGQQRATAAMAARDPDNLLELGLPPSTLTKTAVSTTPSRQMLPRARTPLNLRRVAEVLGQYGLDPSVEIAEILTPVIEVDTDTGVEVERHRLPPETRANILLELMQYAHPKLKAVEMKVEGTIAGMTQEQIDTRLKALIAKASGA